jgi:peptidoglycan DL-endopeptidase CwlO
MGQLRLQYPIRWALCAFACAGCVGAAAAVATPPAQAHRAAPARILHMGSHGHLVRELQRLLHLPADGIFGPGTRHAVRRFQRRHHLLADGQVGPHTWRALLLHHHHRSRRHGHRRHPSGRVLQLGDHGRFVAHAQWLLQIRPTGIYDSATVQKVQRFQRRHHLLADGVVGPHTLHALRRTARHRGGHAGSGHASAAVRAVRVARRYAGVRYQWGGESPIRGFDCSGLVQFAFGRVGVRVPRVTYQQWHAGRHIRHRRRLRRGDLVFFHHLGHVGFYLGHGWFLSAPTTGSYVHVSTMRSGWYSRHYDGAVRIA